MTRSPKDIARDVLCHALGVPTHRPAKLSPEAQTIADMMAGVSRPERGTPEHELATALQAGRTVESAPKVINRDDLVTALADDKSPAAILVRDLVRAEVARVKSEGGE